MTVTVDGSSCPSVFDAGLPTINYEYAQHPDEAHAIISQAREKAPIAIGPYGPELLTYDLVRTALRDPRFRVPQGMFLAAQGITSGPLWDRVAANILSLNGEEHHRLRRLVCKAFTPKATPRLRTTIVDIITGLVDRHSAHGRCDVVTDIARQYPIPVICALLGAPPEDWELFSSWTDDILKAFSWNAAKETSAILTAWDALDTYIDDMLAHRRHALTDDLISELIRGEDDGEKLDHDELLSLAVALLGTGTDTTRHQRPPAWTFSAIIPTNGRCSISSNSFLTRWGKPCATDLSASPCLASPPNTSSWRGSASRPERSCLPTRQPPTATQQHSAIPTDSISPATTWSAR